MKIKLLTSLLLAAGVLALPTLAAAAAADLNNCCTAGDKDFPKVGGNLGNQNYSALKQINRSNVKSLGAAWLNHVDLGTASGSQSTPVAVGGVIYLETGAGWVIAVDGKTGATKWRVQKTGSTRRGLAVAKDRGLVYTIQSSNLVALDINTGAELWRKAYSGIGGVGKVAVVYSGERLYIGTNDCNASASGASTCAGLIVNAADGALVKAFYGIPQNPGDLGYDTWGDAPPSQRSGAAPWVHPAVDPVLNTVYWTFGNVRGGSSQNGGTRPGLNLFGSSVVAVDATTGEYKWHYQMVHHDHWDMENMGVTLVDTKINGVDRKLVAVTGKTGQYYLLDRIDGSAPLGIDEVAVPVDSRQASWPTQPRPRQGGYTEHCAIWEPLGGPVPGHPARAVPNYPRGCLYAAHWDGAPVLSFPGHGGGADWGAQSFSQSTRLIYTGMGYVGASHSLNEGSNGLRPPGEYMTGAVVAVDPSTNLVRWKKNVPFSVAHGNGILTTASDLLFIGQPDGNVVAMDATNGRELWRFQTGASISATPITYEIDGEQYVAMYAAGTGIPYGSAVKNGDHLYAFKLGAGNVPQGAPFMAELQRRPVSGSAVAGTGVNNTVLLGRTSATSAEVSINSGSTNGVYPTWMTVPLGTTVTFTNPAGSANTHCATQFFEGLFNFSLAPGQSASYTFTKPGEYFYNDCYNPRSTGKIVVSQ
ncbi:MAG: PQQ-binding-like beta-propeller repeat protein [Rubrivivax sp.]